MRGVAGGAAATANWLTNAAVSQTFLTLVQWVGASGAFWMYATIAAEDEGPWICQHPRRADPSSTASIH